MADDRACPHGHIVPESEKYCPTCGLMPEVTEAEKRRYPPTSMFGIPPAPRTKDEISHWWNIRRIHYNVIFVVATILSVVAFFVIDTLEPVLPYPEGDVELLSFCCGPLIGIVMANVFYSLGYPLEMAFRHRNKWLERHIGPVLFAAGIAFSVLVVWSPTIINFLDWLHRLLWGTRLGS